MHFLQSTPSSSPDMTLISTRSSAGLAGSVRQFISRCCFCSIFVPLLQFAEVFDGWRMNDIRGIGKDMEKEFFEFVASKGGSAVQFRDKARFSFALGQIRLPGLSAVHGDS